MVEAEAACCWWWFAVGPEASAMPEPEAELFAAAGLLQSLGIDGSTETDEAEVEASGDE